VKGKNGGAEQVLLQ
jgi:hypothetical protein